MGKRFNCRACRHYLKSGQATTKPKCRFRGGTPSGVCSAFSRAQRDGREMAVVNNMTLASRRG